MWKNIADRARRRWQHGSWTFRAVYLSLQIQTLSLYNIDGFPPQHLLHERASMLRWYIHGHSCLFFLFVSHQPPHYKKKLDLIPLLTSVLCQLVSPLNLILYVRVLIFLSSLTLLIMSSFVGRRVHVYSDTSANEDNSFRNHIR